MTKRAVVPLLGDRIRLRLLAEQDLAATLGWRNDDEIRRWFFTQTQVTPEGHRAWFSRYAERDDDFVFVIEETEELRRPVGQVSIYNVDPAQRRAEYGRLMIGDSRAKGRGLARAATTLVLPWAFSELEIDEVFLEVFRSNAAAIAVYRACGFVDTGGSDQVLRMAVRRAGR